MLSIDEIINMSYEMGVEIRNSKNGKHYILDDSGKELEFNTEMLVNLEPEDVLLTLDLVTTSEFDLGGFDGEYDLAKCKKTYVTYPNNINEFSWIIISISLFWGVFLFIPPN